MKILKIRLKNLNSLAGEWEIDLTHPAFESGGIFAITGPTGAGKTTILDAVCLALYGRTPRLNKVSQSINEIMSRQTGECYAEVCFATRSGSYCCHWSQHRARRKATGDLQGPKHEIADLDTGKIVETGLRGVAEQIELVTGMDFDRFTRSMLLAQGGFAAFLQAAADERAPILEQITGTGIYSRISMKVHELRQAERRRLDILQAELAGMQLLGEEEMGRLQAELEQKSLREAGLNETIAGTSRAIAWLEGIAVLEKEIGALAETKADLARRHLAFQPQRLQLEWALQALELAGEHAALLSLRREQEADRRGHEESLQALPGRQAEVGGAEEALQAADAALIGRQAELQENLPVIRRVRELDLKLGEKTAPLKAAAEAVAALEREIAALQARTGADRQTLEGQRKARQAVQQSLDQTQVDEGLGGQLAAICGRFNALRTFEVKIKGRADELAHARRQAEESRRQWREAQSRQENLSKEYGLAQSAWEKQQVEVLGLLDGRELADWRDDLSALQVRKAALLRLEEAGTALGEARRLQEELTFGIEQFRAERTVLAGRVQEQAARQTALERERGLLETQLTLLQRIEDLDEARRQLRDDEPCPLCGAREHPFAAGNIPAPDETAKALGKVRGDLQEAAETVARLQVMEARIGKDQEHAEARQKDCTETVVRAGKDIARELLILDFDAVGRDLPALLPDLQQQNDGRLAETVRRVQAGQLGEKKLAVLRDAVEKSREALTLAERQGQTAAHARETAEHTSTRLEKELETLAAELAGIRREVLQEVLPYTVNAIDGISDLTPASLDRLQAELTVRRARWQEQEGRKIELDKSIAALEIRLHHGNEQLAAAEADCSTRRQAHAALTAERDLLSGERRELFADKNPDTEESRLLTAAEEAGKKREEAERRRIAASQELEKLKSRLETMEKAMSGRNGQLRILEEDFAHRLRQSGFGDEQAFQAACLPETERVALLRQRERLDTEQTETEARWRDKTQLLAAQRQQQATDRPLAELTRERDGQVLALRELQQEIGGIRGILRENDTLRQRQREKVAAIAGQTREFRRWDMLHGLIGSADGKKYRNFAQGLTFEIMIGHANRQLQKMTDRYLLIRDEAQPLDLNVVDGYQAGEIRSTRNLSGGESFLVSLALALGLSQMASKNVRVDSLFLDEGFGTLDEEALDTALQTLAGLQQDGKMIGVISHVPALRERIGTRIQVNSRTGGRSVIEGPGCRRKEEG